MFHSTTATPFMQIRPGRSLLSHRNNSGSRQIWQTTGTARLAASSPRTSPIGRLPAFSTANRRCNVPRRRSRMKSGAQIKAHLNVGGAEPIRDENLITWFPRPRHTVPEPLCCDQPGAVADQHGKLSAISSSNADTRDPEPAAAGFRLCAHQHRSGLHGGGGERGGLVAQ